MRSSFPGLVGALSLLLLAANAGAQRVPALPPLADPPQQHLPGKFVWSDLVTSKFEIARSFYQELFDLQWRDLSSDSDRYGVLEHDGHPVAGIAYRPESDEAATGAHWLHFMSVANIDMAVRAAESAGGATLLGPRDVGDRGLLAVIAGPGGEALGLIHSSSGDPPDYRAEQSDWIWWELLTDEVERSSLLLADLCQCEVAARPDQRDRFLLTSQGYARAAIGPLNESAPAIWLGFVRVGDIATTVSEARRLGAEVLIEPGSIESDSELAVIQDPAGGVIGLLAWTFTQGEPTQ